MFKLVVLSALFAAVACKPGAILAPYTAYSSVVVPATTTITKSASSVVHPSPFFYSTPLAYTHFIKKRSPQLLAYNYAPYVSTYATAPLLSTPVVSSPWAHSTVLPAAHVAYSAAHLIKKRSAPVFVAPTTYAAAPVISTYATAPVISSYAAAPVVSTYAAAPVLSTPLVHSTPLISTPFAHLIKKRSAPLLTTYVAPSSFSHQSRVDITHAAPALKLATYPTSYISHPYYF